MVLFSSGKKSAALFAVLSFLSVLYFLSVWTVNIFSLSLNTSTGELNMLWDNTSPPNAASPQGSTSNSRAIAFHLDQESFVSQLAECILNSSENKCHIMYRHLSKTGGTGLNTLFFSLAKLTKHSGCCGPRMQVEFYAKTNEFCPRHFQSYEVMDGFDEMVYTCQDLYYKDIKDHKLLLLTTVREPISQTLSHIHHTCNKMWDQRDNETQEACTACKFEEHPDFWMFWPSIFNVRYEIIANQTMGSLKEFDHLFLDLLDIDKMVKMLSERLSPVNEHYTNVFTSYFNQKHNVERLDHCSFGLSTQMIKALKPAQDFYRNFILNGLAQD